MNGRAKSFRTYNRQGEGGLGFLFVGNRLCLDFVNTRVIEHGKRVDRLGSWTDVVRWLTEARLLGPREAREATATKGRSERRLLRQVLALRGAIERMIARLTEGRPVSRSSVAAINKVLHLRPRYLQVVPAMGQFQTLIREEPAQGLALLARVAGSAAWLLTNDDRSRVRRCSNPACILYFYDTTRSRTRRWCSMQGCGNRLKVAAHRQRLRN